MSNSHLQTLYAQVNKEINNLFTWFCANKLSLNANKTKYILIRPKQKRCDLSTLNIYINNMELNRIGHDCEEKAAKFLGIFIDEYLTWQHHVSHVNSKVARSLFAIKQVKHFLHYPAVMAQWLGCRTQWLGCRSRHCHVVIWGLVHSTIIEYLTWRAGYVYD